MRVIPLGGCVLLTVVSGFIYACALLITSSTYADPSSPLWERACQISGKDKSAWITCGDEEQRIKGTPDEIKTALASQSLHVTCRGYRALWTSEVLIGDCK